MTLPLANAAEGKGLSKLWARRKIADAEVARTLRTVTPEETDKRILALGLDHQLVTRLTSLVAVDKTPSRPDGVRLSRADLPLNLPAGWEFDKVFGARNATAADDRLAHADASRRADLTAAPRRQQRVAQCGGALKAALRAASGDPCHPRRPARRCRRLRPMPSCG